MPVADVARHMLDVYPRELHVDQRLLVRCIEACSDCAEACTQCADDCLTEPTLQEELTKCVRLNLDCTDMCTTTGRVVSRQTGYDPNVTRAVLQACVVTCRACAEECDIHARHGMKHCEVCAEECRGCEQACQELLDAIG